MGSLIVIVSKKSQKSLLRLLSTTGKKSKTQKGIWTKQNSQSRLRADDFFLEKSFMIAPHHLWTFSCCGPCFLVSVLPTETTLVIILAVLRNSVNPMTCVFSYNCCIKGQASIIECVKDEQRCVPSVPSTVALNSLDEIPIPWHLSMGFLFIHWWKQISPRLPCLTLFSFLCPSVRYLNNLF